MPSLTSIKTIAAGLVPKRRKRVLGNHGDVTGQRQQDDSNNFLPPLRPVDLPRILPEHRSALSDQGWTKVTFHEPVDELHRSSQALFRASKEFFDLPSAQKEAYKTKEGTEEGWIHVEGEKEFITLRQLGSTPPELKEAALAYWAEAGTYLDELLGQVAESLGLAATALDVYSKPCAKLQLDKTATMLRLFRYDSSEEREAKIVAEAHRDLGLLSLVIGDTPGLEVWNQDAQFWFPIEKDFDSPAGCVMVGRQLERLSNMRYHGGGHRVLSYGDTDIEKRRPSADSPRYRYSIVFVLRAHSPVPVNTDALTSSITGQFQKPLNGIVAHDLFKSIHSSAFNINTGIQERNEQKQRLAEKKAGKIPSAPS